MDNNVTQLANQKVIKNAQEIAGRLLDGDDDQDVRRGSVVLLNGIIDGVCSWESLSITPPQLIKVIRDEVSGLPVIMRNRLDAVFAGLLWEAGVPKNMIDALYDAAPTKQAEKA